MPLAGFFLKKLLRRGCDFNDLSSLDAELHRSLLFLRDYQGDVEDLALTFTITDADFGTNREVRLCVGPPCVAMRSSQSLPDLRVRETCSLHTRACRADKCHDGSPLLAPQTTGGLLP